MIFILFAVHQNDQTLSPCRTARYNFAKIQYWGETSSKWVKKNALFNNFCIHGILNNVNSPSIFAVSFIGLPDVKVS